MEKSQVVGIFVRLCFVLAILCVGCLFIVEPGSPEMVITIVTLSINLSVLIIYYLFTFLRRKKKDEKVE